MKTKLFLSCLIGASSLVLPVHAQLRVPIKAQAHCSIDHTVVQCLVFNSWNIPMYCELRVRDRVNKGIWFSGYERILPGQNAYVQVSSNTPRHDRIVAADGSANCRF